MGRFTATGTRRLAALAAVLVAVVAATAATAGGAAQAKKPPTVKPYSKSAWAALIERAKKEGTVTVFTVGAPANYANLGARLKELYGVNLVVNRATSSVLLPQVNAAMATGNGIPDLWVEAAKPYILGALKNGWVVDARGPNFFKTPFNRKQDLVGKAWLAGAALLGMCWNTGAFGQGVKDIPDFLNSAFKGKLGILDPRGSPAGVEWYLWLERTYGKSILQRLAAQNPRLYLSSLQMAQAVASGEINGSPYCAGSSAVALKQQGAPIEFKLPGHGSDGNSAYVGMIMKRAPHPAAAQLLADFIVTREGQALHNFGLGALYKSVSGTFYAKPYVAPTTEINNAVTAAYSAEWAKLFVK